MKKKYVIALAIMIVSSFFIFKGVQASDLISSTNDRIESAEIGKVTFHNESNASDAGSIVGGSSTDYVSTVTLAGTKLRTQIMDRKASCTVYYKADASDYDNDKFSKLASQIYESALKHTGLSDQGDYLRWGAIESVQISGSTTSQGLVITYKFTYYTTENQEMQLQTKLTEIMKGLDLDGRSNYEKVVAIYNYICEHVSYDYEHDADNSYGLKRTAYGAIFNGKANCQGYSVLFYRMALSEGIDCRVIGGYGKNRSHGWDIVKLDNYYYYVDPTWDAEQEARNYFLKGQNNFPDHTPDTEYKGYDFTSRYPVDTKDYKPNSTSGSCGKNLTWKLSQDHVLTISGTGYMYTYTESIPAPWDYVKKDIQKIVCESSVQYIGPYAFKDCTELKEVTFGSSLFRVGECAFKNCSKLEKVDFPKKLSAIQDQAFYGCTKLKRITFAGEYRVISSNAFQKVSAMAYHPYGDSSWDCVDLKPASYQFGGTLDWKIWSGKSEDDPEAKSGSCGEKMTWELQTDLLKINGSGKMYDWIDEKTCPWHNYRDIIKKISIDSSVETIGENAFSDFSKLEKIQIPKKITSIGKKALSNCTSLLTIEFKGSLPTISSNAFYKVSAQGEYPGDADSTWDDVQVNPEKYQYGGDIDWREHNYFVLGKHNNSFTHSTENFATDFATDYADKLLARATKKSEKEHLQKKMKEKWDGSCSGIEVSIIQNKRAMLGYSKDYYTLGIPKNDRKLLSIINYYQLTQYLNSYSTTMRTQKNKKNSTSLKTFLQALVLEAKQDQENQTLSVFNYYYEKGEEVQGHAEILCGYQYGDFDNDGKKEHRLKIYDCNSRYQYSYMYVADDYSSFTYIDQTISGGKRLETCYTELSYISYYDICTKSYYDLGLGNYWGSGSITITPAPGIGNIVGSGETKPSEIVIPSDAITLNVYTDVPFKMVNAEGKTLIYDGKSFTGTMQVYDYKMIGEQNVEINITTDASDSFSVSDITDEFYLGAEIDGHYYAAKSDGAQEITLSKKDGVEVKGSNLFTFEMTKGTDLENSDLISVSGTAQADKLHLDSDKDKVQFTSDKNCSDLKMKTYKDTDKKEQTINQKTNSVTVKDSANNTVDVDAKPIKKDIKSCQISLKNATKYVYDGKEKKPEVVVKDGSSKQLTLSKDYKVTYSDNINAGEGSIIITGIGDYTGQVTYKFSIEKQEQDFEIGKQEYVLYVNDKDTIQVRNAVGKISFLSENPEIVSVDTNGEIKAVKAGSTTILVNINGYQNYASESIRIKVVVKEKEPEQKPPKEETTTTTENKVPTKPAPKPTVKIKLSTPSIKKLKNKKKGQIQVQWSKCSKVSGYQIQYATDKKFKKNKKTLWIKKNISSATIKKLKRKRSYYIRIRSYKKVSSKKYYSKWSKVKSIKIKK